MMGRCFVGEWPIFRQVVAVPLKGVTHAMAELKREAVKLKPMKRPRNARGSEAAREEFERKITAAFIAGMRATATYE